VKVKQREHYIWSVKKLKWSVEKMKWSVKKNMNDQYKYWMISTKMTSN
jgi:hypothetical protein